MGDLASRYWRASSSAKTSASSWKISNSSELGTAKRIVIGKDNTLIVEGAGTNGPDHRRPGRADSPVKSKKPPAITIKRKTPGTPGETDRRCGRGEAPARTTETEMKERKDLIDDALHAVKASAVRRRDCPRRWRRRSCGRFEAVLNSAMKSGQGRRKNWVRNCCRSASKAPLLPDRRQRRRRRRSRRGPGSVEQECLLRIQRRHWRVRRHVQGRHHRSGKSRSHGITQCRQRDRPGIDDGRIDHGIERHEEGRRVAPRGRIGFVIVAMLICRVAGVDLDHRYAVSFSGRVAGTLWVDRSA